MQGLYALYRKEMGHYFVSPVAYVVVGIFLLLCAIFFNYFVSAVVLQGAQAQMQGMGAPTDMPGEVYRAFFGLLSTLILFLTPMLTMGVYAEERKRGTMELLMTSPVTELQIVIAKFLAALSLFAAMLLPTVAGLGFLYFCSDPHPPGWFASFDGHFFVVAYRKSADRGSACLRWFTDRLGYRHCFQQCDGRRGDRAPIFFGDSSL
jgi:ABC-2 type transport system permease protein